MDHTIILKPREKKRGTCQYAICVDEIAKLGIFFGRREEMEGWGFFEDKQ